MVFIKKIFKYIRTRSSQSQSQIQIQSDGCGSSFQLKSSSAPSSPDQLLKLELAAHIEPPKQPTQTDLNNNNNKNNDYNKSAAAATAAVDDGGDDRSNKEDETAVAAFKQFKINYEEITNKVEIGRGRFSKVYKGNWHGPHAIKEIDLMTNNELDSEQLRFINEEIANLRKTRHANLILFVGACVKPPICAIVMSLCSGGVSLYKLLRSEQQQHQKKSTADGGLDWIVNIAIQIVQGMAYLHNKQLNHKDLRSKNVIIDGNRAMITDFGLYALTRMCSDARRKKLDREDDGCLNRLLPFFVKEHIYYMAPELVRSLGKSDFDAHFSNASDVFSFGTVWYELLYKKFPQLVDKNGHAAADDVHSIIYLIGSGKFLSRLQQQHAKTSNNDFRQMILASCWSPEAGERSSFSQLLDTFRSLPKRSASTTRLVRSPSHPSMIVGSGRSLESLNK